MENIKWQSLTPPTNIPQLKRLKTAVMSSSNKITNRDFATVDNLDSITKQF